MPKQLQIEIFHTLVAREQRRRLDRETDWAMRRLEKGSMRIAIAD